VNATTVPVSTSVRRSPSCGQRRSVTSDDTPCPGGIRTDDDATTGGQMTYRVARGGSFTRFGDFARSRRRHGPHTDRQLNPAGFRLAESNNG
jgi:formylglycine-generating enzyme required for sulfatase activity